MKSEEDAFGQMLWAFYNGRKVFEVFERSDNFLYIDSPRNYFSEYQEWPVHQKQAMKYVKGRILDVGCGAGRHALYLQKKGFDVLGIDASPLAIEICKLRGLKKAQIMSLEEINFKSNSFDSILLMGNNFSLFGGFKKAQRLLKKLHKICTTDALIIAETLDPYKTEDSTVLEYYKSNKKKGRMRGQYRLRVRFEKYISTWFDWLKVSKEEMREILSGTNWKAKEFLYSKNSQYIAIIEKK